MRRLSLIIALLLIGGCTSTVRQTQPPRTATEIYLHSDAAADATMGVSAAALAGRAVHVDASHVDTADPDARFFLAQFRAQLLQQDVRLVDREKAEIIVEVRFAGLGVDRTGTFVGVPAAAVAPFVNESVGADAVDRIPPEIEIYQSRRQQGYGSVSYIAYWADSGLLVTGGGPGLGRSELNRRKLLFLNLNRSTIPTVQE